MGSSINVVILSKAKNLTFQLYRKSEILHFAQNDIPYKLHVTTESYPQHSLL